MAIEPLPRATLERTKWNRKAPVREFKPSDVKADLRRVIERFATRAFRRPLEPGEVDGLVQLACAVLDDKKSFEDAAIAFRAVLTSPQFLMFDERPGQLSDDSSASRLSYFLWSTLPDDELLTLAAEKKLSQPAVLRAQVERMLGDGKSRALVEKFVGQWLELRNIDATTPDRRLYPEFDELLKLSMVQETEELPHAAGRRPERDELDPSDFAILNRRLAEHYGIDEVRGEQFRRVSLPANSHRGGLLTQASVLKVTANGTVTSPVLRGAWVLKICWGSLLCRRRPTWDRSNLIRAGLPPFASNWHASQLGHVRLATARSTDPASRWNRST